jgi:signal transduction histidine kinase
VRRFSIRQQVAWLTLAPLFVIVACLETFFLYSRFSDLDQGLLDRANTNAHQLAVSGEYGVFSNNRAFLQDLAEGVLRQQDVRAVVILDAALAPLAAAGKFSMPAGEVFTGAEIAASDYFAGQSGMDHALVGDDLNLHTPARTEKGSIWSYHPIIPAQLALDDLLAEKPQTAKKIGAVILEVSRLRTDGIKARILRITVIATALFLGLVFYLMRLSSRTLTSPIRTLSGAVQAIGRGDLATRVRLRTQVRELDTLAQGLNEMAAQLQQERAILQQRIDDATRALRAKKDEAERASHDKSRFLAVASHDLRQPLHALGLYVAELQRKLSGTPQQRLAEQIEQSVESLSALLNALLDISKLDAGAIVPQVRPCDVETLLDRITADYQMLADVKNIGLKVRRCDVQVTSDPVLLERILMNLVSNAVRYTPQGGRVLVACRRRGDLLRIEVRDNGVGISKADQDNIFREFFQLAQPELDNSKGLGLGLAIVDRLVKLLGHRIELRSTPGRGTMFALEVPLAARYRERLGGAPAKPGAGARANLGDENASLNGKRILVVDDDAAVLSGTAGAMVSWGCTVSMAASLAEVERLIREGGKWDFVVSDYQLDNETNGLDVIDLVRRHQDGRVPCLLISGDTSPAVLKLVSVSGYHLLHKPVRPAKLRSLIVHLLADGGRDG